MQPSRKKRDSEPQVKSSPHCSRGEGTVQERVQGESTGSWTHMRDCSMKNHKHPSTHQCVKLENKKNSVSFIFVSSPYKCMLIPFSAIISQNMKGCGGFHHFLEMRA